MLSTRHRAAFFGVFALVALGAAAWPFTVDDAYIVVRYADRIASGAGYSFSGPARSDGVTGPLWLLPLVLASSLGVDPLAVAKLTSLTAGLVAGWLVLVRAGSVAMGRTASFTSALVLLGSLPFVVWSVAGLETGLAALAATTLALAVTARPRGNGPLAGLSVAALVWLRPELVPYALCLLGFLTLREWRSARSLWALALLAVVSLVVFRVLMFGHVLPMSASAKPASFGHGVSYLGDTLMRPRVWVLLPLLGIALVTGTQNVRVWLLALVVHALAVLLVGGDWMPGRRLFAPIVPVLALGLGLGLRAWWLKRPRLVSTLLLGLLATSLLELVPELVAVRAAGVTRELRLPALARVVCSARGPVAIVDLGAIGVSCPEQTFLDLGGLTEPTIAYARGGHLDKHIDLAWLRAQRPGLLVLHSASAPRVDAQRRLRWFAGYPVERRVLAAFLHDYRVQEVIEYTPRYFYVVMAEASSSAATNPLPARNAP